MSFWIVSGMKLDKPAAAILPFTVGVLNMTFTPPTATSSSLLETSLNEAKFAADVTVA